MLILQGCNALSKFRINKLISTAQAYIPEIISIDTYFIHFIDESEKLNKKELAQLDVLLNYGKKYNFSDKYEKLIVVPRFGTISPWSSKATDIAHNSGLRKIKRIERGTVYLLEVADEKKLTHQKIKKIYPLIH